MQVTKVICDMCGVAKGESNHWFAGIKGIEPKPFLSIVTCPVPIQPSLEVPIFDLCGAACVGKFVDQWVDSERKRQQENDVMVSSQL